MQYQKTHINEETALLFLTTPHDIDELLNLIINSVFSEKIQTIALKTQDMSPDFFNLSTKYAGNLLQKLTNYGIKIIIIGDIQRYKEKSKAFHDFVLEANHGNSIKFISHN